jgi:hypothetical protein
MISARLQIKPATKEQTYRSGRLGTIHASYDELVELFGEPHDCTKDGQWFSSDGKIRVEWAFVIKGDEGRVFTIYDYKSQWPLDKIKQWNLGGKDVKIKDSLALMLKVE